jgi:hypothetical protein
MQFCAAIFNLALRGAIVRHDDWIYAAPAFESLRGPSSIVFGAR